MTQVSISEFRKNIKMYSELAQKQDFEVLNHGQVVFIVKSPRSKKIEAFNRLCGSLKTDLSYDEILSERVNEL